MKFVRRPFVAAAIVAAAAAVLVVRSAIRSDETIAPAANASALPRLVEFGADKCVPCRAMKPVLAELRAIHAGALIVESVDVWRDREAGKAAAIGSIPTQVFYDAQGREIYRHTGFISRRDIEARFSALGINLGSVR